jgi:RNA methyltransferase, TrmH family
MLSRADRALLRGLARRRVREAERLFVAEGSRAVDDLLASPLDIRLLVHASSFEDTSVGSEVLRVASTRGIRVEEVPDSELDALADTQTPQGVLAVGVMPDASLAELAPGPGRNALLLMDAVQDPGNFGTMVRTAEALGARGVITLPGTVDPWNAKSVRSAMGSSFRIPVVGAAWEEAGTWLREHAFTVLVADAAGEPLGDVRPDRAALVVGNEGAGVSAAARIHADRTVAIPLRGRAESMNVAAAAAILLYEMLR